MVGRSNVVAGQLNCSSKCFFHRRSRLSRELIKEPLISETVLLIIILLPPFSLISLKSCLALNITDAFSTSITFVIHHSSQSLRRLRQCAFVWLSFLIVFVAHRNRSFCFYQFRWNSQNSLTFINRWFSVTNNLNSWLTGYYVRLPRRQYCYRSQTCLQLFPPQIGA